MSSSIKRAGLYALFAVGFSQMWLWCPLWLSAVITSSLLFGVALLVVGAWLNPIANLGEPPDWPPADGRCPTCGVEIPVCECGVWECGYEDHECRQAEFQ